MGLLITRMSEKLWLNSNLNLGIAVTQARQSEMYKQQTIDDNDSDFGC